MERDALYARTGMPSTHIQSLVRTQPAYRSPRTSPLLPCKHHANISSFKQRIPVEMGDGVSRVESDWSSERHQNWVRDNSDGMDIGMITPPAVTPHIRWDDTPKTDWSKMMAREVHHGKTLRRTLQDSFISKRTCSDLTSVTTESSLPAMPFASLAVQGEERRKVVDPYRLPTTKFDHTDTMRDLSPESNPIGRSTSVIALKARGKSVKMHRHFSLSGRLINASFSMTYLLPPLHKNLGPADVAKAKLSSETQERYGKMRHAQEQDRQRQAAIKEENLKKVKGNELENLLPIMETQGNHLFEEIPNWKEHVPPFFHSDDLYIAGKSPGAESPVAEPAAGRSPAKQKSKSQGELDTPADGVMFEDEEKQFTHVLSEYARLFWADSDLEALRIARPTFCRFLFDCNIIDVSFPEGSEGKAQLLSAVLHFDALAEMHPSLPRPSVRIDQMLSVIIKIFCSLGGPGREQFVKGLSHALICVGHERELQEKAQVEYEKDIASRQKAETDVSPPIQWPPPIGVTLSDWVKGDFKPTDVPTEALLELKQQCQRNTLMVRHQLCEPEIVQWAEQFKVLFANIFDAYRDFSTTHLGVANEHMSFEGLLRFCLDFGLFPDMVSYEELQMLYNDVVECVECVDIAEDAQGPLWFASNERLTKSAKANRDTLVSLPVKTSKPRHTIAVGGEGKQFRKKNSTSAGKSANKLANFSDKSAFEMSMPERNMNNLLRRLGCWLLGRYGTVKSVLLSIGGKEAARMLNTAVMSYAEFYSMLQMLHPSIIQEQITEKDAENVFELLDAKRDGAILISDLDKLIKLVRKKAGVADHMNNCCEMFLKLEEAKVPIISPEGKYRIFGFAAFMETLLLITFLRLQKGNVAQTQSSVYLKALWLPTYLHSVFMSKLNTPTTPSKKSDTTPIGQLLRALGRSRDWWIFLNRGDKASDKTVVCGTCHRSLVLGWGSPCCPDCSCGVSITKSCLLSVIIGKRMEASAV